MGGCASRPKELDGKTPEDFTAEQVAPSDATAVAATTTVAANESNENVEKENKEVEVAELSASVEPEDKEEARVEPSEPEIEVATVEASEQKAETTKDTPNAEGGSGTTNKDVVKEETKTDEKVSQS